MFHFFFFFFEHFLYNIRIKRLYAKLKIIWSNIGKNSILLSDERYNEFKEKVLTLECSKTNKKFLFVLVEKINKLLQKLHFA